MRFKKINIKQEFNNILDLIDIKGIDNEITLNACQTLKYSLDNLFKSYSGDDYLVLIDIEPEFPETRLCNLLLHSLTKEFSPELILMIESAIKEIQSTRISLCERLEASLSEKEKNNLNHKLLEDNISTAAKDYLVLKKILNR